MNTSPLFRTIPAITILAVIGTALVSSAEPLREEPRHRYSFNGTGSDGARIVDSIGKLHGTLAVQGGDSQLSGKGGLILDALAWNAEARFTPELVTQYENFSLEFWFTPTATKYAWHIVYRLDNNHGKNGDYFWYALRNFQTHRVEIADDGLNENMQSEVEGFEEGKPVHLVVTYEANEGASRSPLVRWFAQGKQVAQKSLDTRLQDLELTRLILGPTQGTFDEFRVYDYALAPSEVSGNSQAGPDKIPVAK